MEKGILNQWTLWNPSLGFGKPSKCDTLRATVKNMEIWVPRVPTELATGTKWLLDIDAVPFLFVWQGQPIFGSTRIILTILGRAGATTLLS